MDVGLPSFQTTTQGAHHSQLLLYDGIQMNKMKKRFPGHWPFSIQLHKLIRC